MRISVRKDNNMSHGGYLKLNGRSVMTITQRHSMRSPTDMFFTVALALCLAGCGEVVRDDPDTSTAGPDTPMPTDGPHKDSARLDQRHAEVAVPDLPAADLSAADLARDGPAADLAAVDKAVPSDTMQDGASDGAGPVTPVLVAGGLTTVGPASPLAGKIVLIKAGFEAGGALCNSAAGFCLMGSVVP
jgi:hypothetical protein